MVKRISKIIARSIMGLILILLVVESSFIIPAYFNLIFDAHAIASKGARKNYVSSQDVVDLKANITKGNTDNRYGTITVVTTVENVEIYGNRTYNKGDTYPIQNNLPASNTLQRGDTYVLKVEAVYYFLMPDMFGINWSNRRTGVPMTLSYEVPITCLKFLKEIR